jgi:glycosyltransferase involved in cell wall biosynthesis
MISGKDIVIVGQQPWDVEIGSNCKNIALEFAKHNRVLYVNSPIKRKEFLKNNADDKLQFRKRVIKKEVSGLVEIYHNFWNLFPNCFSESVHWLPDNFIFDIVNKINSKRFAKTIKEALKKLDFKDIILFNDNDLHDSFHLKELLKPKLSIYYSRDYILATEYWNKHGKKLEPLLITKSDLVVSNSVYLTNYCKQYNQSSFYVGQGCDFDLFLHPESIPKAEELKEIQKPIIGYVGAITSSRLDIEIIQQIASNKPEWTVVLVGNEDETFQKSNLHQQSNVLFLGSKKVDELAKYINSFDVCINPQLLNQLTIGNYPRKIDEYLALGKPVVATQTEAMEVFKDYVFLAKDKEEYTTLIEQALLTNTQQIAQARIAFALTHTWENSVKEIYKAINTKLKR